MTTLQLRSLRVEDEDTFRKAVNEFKRHEPNWTFAFDFGDSQCFTDYVEMLERWKVGKDLPKKFVPNTFLVGVVGKEIVGRVSIRHVLNDFLERYGGHIGYGVIPSCRNLGYASDMLKQVLSEACSLDMSRVLITCDDGNTASMKVIEKNGGILENIVSGDEIDIPKRRYWITIEKPSMNEAFI